MKTKKNYVVLSLFVLLLVGVFFSCKSDRMDAEHEELIAELDSVMFPLSMPPFSIPEGGLDFLAPLRDAKIVALGEATHGTKDFFQMKHRVFRYLVEYCGHKAMGMEADFAESIYIDRWITGGEGDLEEWMSSKMYFWATRNKSVKLMLQWMRNYNQGKPKEEMIRYFGMDCQGLYHHPVLLREYLEPIHPRLWDVISPIVTTVAAMEWEDFKNLEPETYEDYKLQFEEAEQRFAEAEELLTAQSSHEEYALHLRILTNMRYALIVNTETQAGWFRDKFMAENALWYADYLGADTKLSVWAHNDHISKDGLNFGGYNIGHHLEGALGPEYQNIGLTFCKGEFFAYALENGKTVNNGPQEITEDPPSDSLNYVLHHASRKEFAVHLSGLPAGSKWNSWLQKNRSILLIGSVYLGTPVTHYSHVITDGQYDWLIHIDETQASEILAQDIQ